MTGTRTITLLTVDHGLVTLDEPAWCVGHTDHRPETHRADILHKGPDVELTFRGGEVLVACLAQSPYATLADSELGGPTIGVSVYPPGRTLPPVGLYQLAASLDSYADQIRGLAEQLTRILAGGDR
ncbi:DUF6907 domain-containing protein [Streptomyces sp. SP18BB07]|uniref:DUF6907 domain-containing protein n=1 Tax=Streptomyces sp. SP18BB07 TaxID=3002522 RepID=UPI002E76A764|nr:hypothetical protein [Streptomyces sp. SP18BB07]MEE1763683.1 hypothetical protein [Streptomyces sp. SP18BB07]